MLERNFQSKLIKELKAAFPGAVVLKTDPAYIQGFPDLLILNGANWAALETKRSHDEPHRPNQDYYIDVLGEMSYANFIFPENKKDILDELQQTFRTRGTSRLLGRQ